MPRLGRVTLLAGENGVGKTTVLDAIRVYAARGRHSALLELTQRREEITTFTDEDTVRHEPRIRALFPCASIDTIADADHWLHAERPAAVTDRIGRFVDEAAAG